MEEREILKVTETDIIQDQLGKKGIGQSEVITQIKRFTKGFPFVELLRPCTIGDGIHVFDQERKNELINKYLDLSSEASTVKFVPASGAASRMFRDLVAEYDLLQEKQKTDKNELPATSELVSNLRKFAFSKTLGTNLEKRGLSLESLINNLDYLHILSTLLDEDKMNYSNIPKGLVEFHSYKTGTRTAFEEHLAEAVSYLSDHDGFVLVHFTVPGEFLEEIKDLVNKNKKYYETKKLKIKADYSVQKESTDTIAVDNSNNPVIDKHGRLVFRPGGHGALLENLNEIDGDMVFIKNIDNVLVKKYLDTVSSYKEMLAGLLIEARDRVFGFIRMLEETRPDNNLIEQIQNFIRNYLFIDIYQTIKDKSDREKVAFLQDFLNRPIRVCGVVRNQGEPGGGPFWVENTDGVETLQIVESAQVDMDDKKQLHIWRSSTHFNPVDIVCWVKDFRGNKFDLASYVDREAGIITNKSLEGRDIKALELPGLWNGSMSDWITLFAEVPVSTFSPVKTVFDLLRKEHQGNNNR